jgi:8-oxo-dGTP diphosphatase
MPMSAYKRRLRELVGHDLLQAPGVVALIHDDTDRLLLQRRGDSLWGLPGGELDPDETPADGLLREIWEEMGVLATPLRLRGIFSGPDWHVIHPGGDEDAGLDLVFACRLESRAFRFDGEEVLDAAYLPLDEALALPLSPSDRRVIFSAATPADGVRFDPPTWQPPADGHRSYGIPPYERGLRAKIGHQRVMVPAVGVVVRDAAGRILLQRRADNGRWAPPAGAMDPLETPADAACRETWEETGVVAELVRVAGIYGGPHYHFTYLASGDQAALLSIVLEGRPIGGAPTPDGHESTEVAYFLPEEALGLVSEKWVRRLHPILAGEVEADFDPPAWKAESSE